MEKDIFGQDKEINESFKLRNFILFKVNYEFY